MRVLTLSLSLWSLSLVTSDHHCMSWRTGPGAGLTLTAAPWSLSPLPGLRSPRPGPVHSQWLCNLRCAETGPEPEPASAAVLGPESVSAVISGHCTLITHHTHIVTTVTRGAGSPCHKCLHVINITPAPDTRRLETDLSWPTFVHSFPFPWYWLRCAFVMAYCGYHVGLIALQWSNTMPMS